MNDIFKSIKAFLYDRTVSPLFGAFVMSWLAWNYRVLIIVFDGKSALIDKLNQLDLYFADDHIFTVAGFSFHVIGGGHFVHGLVMPAVIAWLYLYAYPKLAKPVYQHALTIQKELKDIKQERENARLLTVEESRNLQKEIEQLRVKSDDEVKSFQERINSLVETINTLEEEAKTRSSVTDDRYKVGHGDIQEAILNEQEFLELIQQKALSEPDGEVKLSQLLANEGWPQFSDSKKARYEKMFAQLITNAKIPNVFQTTQNGNERYEKRTGFLKNELNEFSAKESISEIERKLAIEIVLSNPLIQLLRKENMSDDQIIMAVIRSSGPLDFGSKMNLEKDELERVKEHQNVIGLSLNTMRRKLSEMSSYKEMFSDAPPLQEDGKVNIGALSMAAYIMNEQAAQEAKRKAAQRAADEARGRAIGAGLSHTPQHGKK